MSNWSRGTARGWDRHSSVVRSAVLPLPEVSPLAAPGWTVWVSPSIAVLTLTYSGHPGITRSHNRFRAKLRPCNYTSVRLQTVSSEQNLSLYSLHSPMHSVHGKSCQPLVIYNILSINVTFDARCLKLCGLCEADRQAE